MSTEAQSKAKKKYREGVKRFTIDFPPPDSAQWEHLQTQKNKQRYLKDLILADMEKNLKNKKPEMTPAVPKNRQKKKPL